MDIMSSLPLSSVPPLQAKGSEAMKLKKAAQAFEGYFVYMLFREMQKTTPKKSLFGSGPGGEIYEHLFQQAMADKITAEGGMGLTSFLMNALERREKSQNGPQANEGPLPLRPEKAFPLHKEGLVLPKGSVPFSGETPLNLSRKLTDKSLVDQNMKLMGGVNVRA